MMIPEYPEFTPISLDLRDDLYPRLNFSADGISEFTFANLWLFRRRYEYTLSRVKDSCIIISGRQDGKSFFMIPCAVPSKEILTLLFQTHDYWKNIPARLLEPARLKLEEYGYTAREDRNNFDYLYIREDLALLSGKKYHKKRNQVNSFTNSYTAIMKKLSSKRIGDALAVLETWRAEKGQDGDYVAAREALENADILGLNGAIWYVEGRPVAWTLGERLAKGRMYAVHFEKAVEGYKGIYQFINQAWANVLPSTIKQINREQDLGDEGLRQAKMTYRPSGFVYKYVVFPETKDPGITCSCNGEHRLAEGMAAVQA